MHDSHSKMQYEIILSNIPFPFRRLQYVNGNKPLQNAFEPTIINPWIMGYNIEIVEILPRRKKEETLFKIGKKECQRLKNHQNFTILDERERSVQAAEKIKVM